MSGEVLTLLHTEFLAPEDSRRSLRCCEAARRGTGQTGLPARQAHIVSIVQADAARRIRDKEGNIVTVKLK